MNAPTTQFATGITTKVTVLAGAETLFAAWQSRFTTTAASARGFVSLEIIPAYPGSPEWHIIQRFSGPDLLELWRVSGPRATLIAELATLQNVAAAGAPEEAAPDFHSLSCVTEVVTTVVEPGKAAEFQGWATSMQDAQGRFPGYMGTLVQAPISPGVPYWTTLVRFATPVQLDAWLNSPERQAVLKRADPAVSKWKSQRMASPFAGWFPSEPDQPPPAAWKQTCLVLLVLFPVVMLEIRFLSPHLVGLHMAVATFIGNAISVSLVSWPLMKVAIFFLNWWLQPDPAHRQRVEALGLVTIAGLYIIELLIFMLLY
jgi:uncharacterized protein